MKINDLRIQLSKDQEEKLTAYFGHIAFTTYDRNHAIKLSTGEGNIFIEMNERTAERMAKDILNSIDSYKYNF